MKKTIIAIFAFVVIALAIFSVWRWQERLHDQPTRQSQEIR